MTDAPAPEPTSAPAPEPQGTPQPTSAPAPEPQGTPQPTAAPSPTPAPEPDKKPDDKPDEKKPDDKAAKKAPEAYDLKPAEGVIITPEVKTKFETVARELDLDQAQAQKLLDLGPELNKMYGAQLMANVEKATTAWAKETESDKEIGGGGDKAVLTANLALAAKARDAFASPELLKLLERNTKENPNGTGLGNHPEVVRLFTRLGKAISEDNKLVTGSGSKGAELSAAEKLYANSTKK